MVEVAEELVETVNCRQKIIAVTKMVLAELSGHVAQRFEQLGESRILLRQAFFRTWQAHFQKASTDWALAGNERSAARSAGLLAVVVSENRAFICYAIDVGCAVSHHAAIVGADVPVTDVVGHDHKDVGFVGGRSRVCERYPDDCADQQRECERSRSPTNH